MSAVRTFKTTAAVSLGALALGTLAVQPAMAAPRVDAQPASVSPVSDAPSHHHHVSLGKVVSRIGVNVRTRPTTHSRIIGAIPSGAIIKIKCKVVGQNVDGNNRWYKLADRPGWVAARWVKNLDHVPWC